MIYKVFQNWRIVLALKEKAKPERGLNGEKICRRATTREKNGQSKIKSPGRYPLSARNTMPDLSAGTF